jgi:hypothetical protein
MAAMKKQVLELGRLCASFERTLIHDDERAADVGLEALWRTFLEALP